MAAETPHGGSSVTNLHLADIAQWKSFGARSFASTERGALPVTARDGGAWKGACARRKSRNPSVLEVVKQHRNFSDDWNP